MLQVRVVCCADSRPFSHSQLIVIVHKEGTLELEVSSPNSAATTPVLVMPIVYDAHHFHHEDEADLPFDEVKGNYNFAGVRRVNGTWDIPACEQILSDGRVITATALRGLAMLGLEIVGQSRAASVAAVVRRAAAG